MISPLSRTVAADHTGPLIVALFQDTLCGFGVVALEEAFANPSSVLEVWVRSAFRAVHVASADLWVGGNGQLECTDNQRGDYE